MIPVRAYFELLAEYLRPQIWRVGLLAAVLVVITGLQLLGPQLIKSFIDGTVAGDPVSDLIPLAVAFMAIAVTHQVLGVWSVNVAEQVGWTATNELRRRLTRHVLGLDMGFHKSHSPGELIERLDGDVTALSNFFSAMLIKVVANGVLIVGILVMLTMENWIFGAAVALLTALTLTGMIRLHKTAVPWWKAVRATSAEFYGFVGEQVEGTEDIEGNGATSFMMKRLVALHRRWLPQTQRGWMGWAMLWSSGILFHVVCMAVAFGVGGWLFSLDLVTLGGIYIVFHYIEMVHRPIQQLRDQLVDLQKAGASIDRVQRIFAFENRLTDKGEEMLPAGPLKVEFDDVTFSYDDDGGDDVVLDQLAFAIGPGRTLGLLGRTGSGKSTIARLVARLYDPVEGAVRIGGIAADAVDQACLSDRVAMVTQDVQLFAASVRDNLTFFDRSISDERLMEVIVRLELEDWLKTLPDGLDTMLDSGGGGLSAGQAQLLAFTRVFLEDPGVVVLDEASSRLDPATEAMLERAVDHLLEGRTGIIIAHRLGTVNRADDILILDSGKLVEHGPRRALAAQPDSRFSQLLATGMEEVLA